MSWPTAHEIPRSIGHEMIAEILPVLRIGRVAHQVLASGLPGTVLAVFRRSFYLEDGQGRLACIGPPGLGDGPLNALCALPDELNWPARGLAVGMAAIPGKNRVSIGGRFAFGFAGALRWQPPGPRPDRQPEMLGRALGALAGETEARLPVEGLGRLLPVFCRNHPLPSWPQDALLRAALPPIAAFSDWLAAATEDPLAAPAETAAGLIGLGPGLTPSGDDFLGGMLIALRSFGQSGKADRLGAWLLPRAPAQTGSISLAHLACAAAGEGAAALHEALFALSTWPSEPLAPRLAALDAIGHCSGWDALTGAVFALSALSIGFHLRS